MWRLAGLFSFALIVHTCPTAADATARLIERLDDPIPSRARAASVRLGKLGPDAVPALVATFEQRNRLVIRQVFRALVLIGEPAAEQIAAAVGHRNPFVRRYALLALAQLEPRPALAPRIRDCLTDDDPLVREQAAATLAGYPGHQTLTALRRASADAEPGVRQEAVRSLGLLCNDPKLPAQILAALTDPVRTNRLVALETVRRLDPGLARYPAEANRLLDLAAALREAGQRKAAGRQLARALTLAPNSPRVHYELGLLRHAAGDAEGREAAFRKALALAPGYRPPLLFAVQRLADQGKLDAALERLAPLLAAPDTPTRRLQATCLAGAGKKAQAAEVLQRLLTRDPGDVGALIALARLQFELGRHAQAEATLGRWISRQPYRGEAHLLLGLALKRQGRADLAEAAFLRGLAQDSRSRALLYNLGVLYDDKLGRPKQALACFRRYLATGGKQPDVPVFVAVLEARLDPTPARQLAAAQGLIRRGYAREAREYLDKVLARQPDQPAANRLLGAVLLERRRGLAALRHLLRGKTRQSRALDRACELIVEPLEQKTAADLLHRSGDLARALALTERCSAKLFGAADFQYLRGEILRGLGRPKAAMTHYRLASQLNGYFGLPHLRMAQLADSAGNREKALTHYRNYLTLCAEAPEAVKRVAELEQQVR